MRHLRIDGYDIAFVEQGSGPPVLLVHGSLSDLRHWAPQMPSFAAAGFRAIAPSLRHFWPEHWDGSGGGFTIDRHVADLAGFIAALGTGPVHLVGHSRGGHIAFRIAERHPGLVRRLVLAEPAGVLDATLLPPGTQPASYADLIGGAVELVRRGEVEAGLRSFAEYTGGPGAWERRTEERRQFARDNAMTLLGQLGEGRKPYERAAAESIRAPTLLVGGALTQPAFTRVLDALEGAIPGARRASIPDAGHSMSRDNPAAFDAAVLDFLRAT
ncbi:alpha/beta fold hydrolase [Falsiroseomonas sp.]|uniref:alpha/beta fold hydrolase n=1 Tax=Falsiroseomonas sp. TaxID=2870721 RepID=UPI0035686041